MGSKAINRTGSPALRSAAQIFVALVSATIIQPAVARPAATEPPAWVIKLIADQPPQSGTVIEEERYHGHRVFLVMPWDRAPDSGNEHVLYSEVGRIICEFGGEVGRVTSGSCAAEQIKYVRTLFPQHQR
jgi:hypothetical protein